MIRPKLWLRRSLAVAGAATLGLAASLAVATPASAHHPIVTGSAVCDTSTGNWKVTWTVTNSEKDVAGEITKVELQPKGQLSKIVVGAEVPKKGTGTLTEDQILPSDQKSAKLTVWVKWKRSPKWVVGPVKGSATVKMKGHCKAPTSKPEATFTDNCEGVVVTLGNHEKATKDAEFVVTGEGGFEEKVAVKAGEQAEVAVPAENAGNVTVTEGGKKIAEHSWTQPEDCVPPAQPTVTAESTCDKLIIRIDNPEDGVTFETVVTPNEGEPQNVVVEPGETKTVEFAASEGLVVAIDGVEGTFAWEKPEDCETPGEGGGKGDDEDTLPVTGVQAGAIAGGAAVLTRLHQAD